MDYAIKKKRLTCVYNYYEWMRITHRGYEAIFLIKSLASKYLENDF